MASRVSQPSDRSSTCSSLIRAAQRKDPAAWDRLAELYAPLIYSWCRRCGLSRMNATDAVQETLLALVRGIGKYDETVGAFRGWLWSVARHQMIDQARRQAAQPRAPGGTDFQQLLLQVPEQFPADETHEQVAWRGVLHRALEQVRVDFQPASWQAFWLVTVEGLSPAEAAVRLQTTAGAVRTARSRIIRRLREILGSTDG